MIRLTRLRNDNALFLNPDHIERLDHHHDTVVRLFNGTEYVVTQTPDEIVELVVMQRARILAVAARLAEQVPDDVVGRAAVSPAIPGTASVPESFAESEGG
jgi:uncharacterized protein YlzI (FlbEa/FlbD family)